MNDTRTTEETTARLDVRSPDGTSLAVWVEGEGPALVLVHGCPSEHSTLDPLVHQLRPRVTTYAMDRRGSGASGDTALYAIEREFEDVSAVVDVVVARVGGPVALWGHSSEIRVLDGHGHFAYKTDPAMVAAMICDFLSA